MWTPAIEKPGIRGTLIARELFCSILETSLSAPVASHKLTYLSLATEKKMLFYVTSSHLGTSHELMQGPALELGIITSGRPHHRTSCLPLSE